MTTNRATQCPSSKGQLCVPVVVSVSPLASGLTEDKRSASVHSSTASVGHANLNGMHLKEQNEGGRTSSLGLSLAFGVAVLSWRLLVLRARVAAQKLTMKDTTLVMAT